MDRTEKIKAISKELNGFLDGNSSLDPDIVAGAVSRVSEEFGITYRVFVPSDLADDLIRKQFFLLGDLVIMETDYDVVPDSENDARIHSVIVGIRDKDGFVASLDPGSSKLDRFLYNSLTGREYSETFS